MHVLITTWVMAYSSFVSNDKYLCSFSCYFIIYLITVRFMLCRYYSHNNDYLEICRCYKAIYEIPSVKEDPAKWIPVNNLVILFMNFFYNVFMYSVMTMHVCCIIDRY